MTSYLDALPLLSSRVGYGSVGLHGELGYEGLSVVAGGEPCRHALSAHAPSLLSFDLGGRFDRFSCRVALNDDVTPGASSATFRVFTDGRLSALVPGVRAGHAPSAIAVDVEGCRQLDLVCDTEEWAYCHSVWLDPVVTEVSAETRPATLLDCLHRTLIDRPAVPLRARRCIATVVSPGYEHLLEDLLGSLVKNGNCPDALTVVFVVDADENCLRVIADHGATAVTARSLSPLSPAVKSILYSVAHIVDADEYLCLDADTMVFGSVEPIFNALAACADGGVLVCRHTCAHGIQLGEQLCRGCGAAPSDIGFLLGEERGEAAYRLVVNDGVFAGKKEALLAVDTVVRGMMPRSNDWVGSHPYRNECLFNLALARLDCGVPMHGKYNVQLFRQDVEIVWSDGKPQVTCGGVPVQILHFSGCGRHRYAELRGCFHK